MIDGERMDPKPVLAAVPAPSYRYQYFTVTSDAMDPTARPGEILVADIEQDRIAGDGLYMLCRAGQPVPRRVSAVFPDCGLVTLSCDNSAYSSEVVPIKGAGAVMVIGRVVAHLRKA